MSGEQTQTDALDWIKAGNQPVEKGAEEPLSGELTLAGSLGIAEAEAMHQSLSRLLDAQVDISIDCDDLSRVDAAGAQLLYALVKEARSRSIKLTWLSVSDALRETVATLGLSEAMAFETSDG